MQQSSVSLKAIFPGTFDPPTYGHISMIKRALGIFGEVIVGVSLLNGKDELLTIIERVELLKELFKDSSNVKVIGFKGLLVNLAKDLGISVIVRGIRTVADFEYEYRMAITNSVILPGIETVFLMSEPEYNYVSSTLVKQIAREGGNITPFVHSIVEDVIRKAIK